MVEAWRMCTSVCVICNRYIKNALGVLVRVLIVKKPAVVRSGHRLIDSRELAIWFRNVAREGGAKHVKLITRGRWSVFDLEESGNCQDNSLGKLRRGRPMGGRRTPAC